MFSILKRICFVAHVLNFNIFVAGTTLENQMQQSVSTLTVSRNLKKCGRRNLSRQMSWISFERKVCNLEMCVGRNMAWKKAKQERHQTRKSKRSKPDSKSILSHSFRIWRKANFFFSSLKQFVLLREFFMGVH